MKIIYWGIVLLAVVIVRCENSFLKNKKVKEQIGFNYTNENSVKVNHCDENICDINFGFCASSNLCVCRGSYANFGNSTACSYERKNRKMALVLELAVPFGASYFYLGFIYMGLIKFLVTFFLPIFVSCLFCCFDNPKNATIRKINSVAYTGIIIIFFVVFFGWEIYDIIKLMMFDLKDSNEIYLNTW